MRQFINILTEGKQDYDAMINPVLDAILASGRDPNSIRRDDPAIDLNNRYRDKIKESWAKQIKSAREILRKQDRVVWYLRLARMTTIENYEKILDPAKINKIKQEYFQRVGTSIENDDFDLLNSLTTLEHYLSLPIPEIQDYQFRFQSYREVISDFDLAETRWKEIADRSIEDDDATVIIDFKNGWFWMNTNKAYCSKEAKAMGHCGNSPRSGSSDRLLSLRKKISMGKDRSTGQEIVRWEPHLTFILNGNGMLTEMKGRGNDKPTEKYHTMIVALLRDPIIEGIVGGGYLPENNFSLNDLDEEVKEELIEEKPDLGSVADLYRAEGGLTPKVKNRLADFLSGMNPSMDIYGFGTENKEEVILAQWDEMVTFFQHRMYNDELGLENLARFARDELDEIEWMDQKTGDKALDHLAESDDDEEEYHTFIKKASTKLGLPEEDTINGILHLFPKSVNSLYETIIEDAKKEAGEICRHYIEEVFPFDFYAAGLQIMNDGSVELVCQAETLIDSIESYQTEDYDDSYDFASPARSGDWLNCEYAENDAKDQRSLTTVYSKYLARFFQEILELFETNEQLSFNF